jgi:type IV pilus assembly protein PilW
MHPMPALRTGCSGFSLVELMISITIGLIIMGAALSAYQSAATASRVAEAQSRMNEDAQAALELLTQHIRMAGANPKQANYALSTPRNPVTNTFSLRGCATGFGNLKAVGATPAATSISALTCPAVALDSAQPHAIAVTYEADRFNTTPTDSGTPTDCLGSSLTAQTASVNKIVTATTTALSNVTFYEADNRFYLDTPNGSNNPSLYCFGSGSGGIPQPLVENIEDLKFSYGVAQASGSDGIVAGYLNAAQIENDATVVNLSTPELRWKRVVTVRICVLARSDNFVTPSAASSQYLNCEGVLQASPPDLRLRKAYFATVSLRNRLP